ncbi:MAG TPA: carbohydrate hydrolase [Clostridiales bacterium]|nr:carbohydrate hydrolase [Clostridiales bacterium]
MKFWGYRRPDGRSGIRNKVLIMDGVLCSAVAAEQVAKKVEGTTYLHNQNGCAQNPIDTAATLEIMSGLIANGNVYGALIIGLGCETTTEEDYLNAVKSKTNKPVYYISIQETGGLERTVQKGVEVASKLVEEANKVQREEIDVSELIIGLECGGSDPTSGISANTVLGQVSDYVVSMGGSAVLSETSEAIGAEEMLRKRGRTPEIGQQIYDAIESWKNEYERASGSNIRDTNPSPGNKKGGLTTLEEKSLGCVHKSGTAPFDAFYQPGQYIDKKGLSFMNTAAYDIVSVTAKIAGGCQLVVFTTGLGTPIGNPIAPVIKVTGNKKTYEFLNDIIDFSTHESLTGEKTISELADKMLNLIIDVSNGKEVIAEKINSGYIATNQLFSSC